MLITILLVLLLLSLIFGGVGQNRFGFVGWSPAGLVLLVLFVLWFVGKLHF